MARTEFFALNYFFLLALHILSVPALKARYSTLQLRMRHKSAESFCRHNVPVLHGLPPINTIEHGV